MTTALIGSGSGIIDLGFSKTIDAPNETIAFHYGDFDDAYGDGTVDAAADNGRVYANTDPGKLPTKFGTITAPTTASGQTTYTWTPPSTRSANVLVVAGGGGGGAWVGGGGGAGGLKYEQNVSLTKNVSISVTVGNGGRGEYNPGGYTDMPYGLSGYDSSFGTTSCSGGGRGGSWSSYPPEDGGSGGGAGYSHGGGDGITGEGFAGGNGRGASTNGYPTGGGGGAGGVGGDWTAVKSGNGGIGKFVGVFGETYGENGWFAGGGGGGVHGSSNNALPGDGGIGGGGNGLAATSVTAPSGLPHTGGGGGGSGRGGSSSSRGGDGGSGIALVRYIMDNNLIVKPDVFYYVSGAEYTSTSPRLYNNDIIGDWVTVYEVGNPSRDGGGNIQYTLNNSVDLSGYSYTRVGYLMTHKFPGRSTIDWVFCTFDKWSSTITDLRVPTTVDAFVQQRNVTNLNVYSSNQTAQPNRNNVAGRLEIWPYNYTQAQSGLLPAGSNTIYDYDDTARQDGSYGSFQCHDVTNGVTCLAWNRHGYTTPDIGIGNNVSTNPFYDSSGHRDWTYAQSFNSDFNLKIMVM